MLESVDLVARRGEILAILGGSGSGKSTTACLIDLYHDDRQSVRLTLDVDSQVRPNKNAHATLAMQGVTGLKVVEITGGNGRRGHARAW